MKTDMKDFKQTVTAELQKALASAPDANPSASGVGKVQIPIHVPMYRNRALGRGRVDLSMYQTDYQLTLFNTRQSIQAALDNVRRIPAATLLTCPRVSMPEHDEHDVAIDIYGDAATAADKLQAQLDRADELEIEERKQRSLDSMIHNLRERAKATNDPAKQRTKHVEALIRQMHEQAEAERKFAAAKLCAGLAENHPDMPELRAEIENLCALVPINASSPLYSCEVQCALSFVPSTCGKRGAPAIRKRIEALQYHIAYGLSLRFDHETKRPDLSSYYPQKFKVSEVKTERLLARGFNCRWEADAFVEANYPYHLDEHYEFEHRDAEVHYDWQEEEVAA